MESVEVLPASEEKPIKEEPIESVAVPCEKETLETADLVEESSVTGRGAEAPPAEGSGTEAPPAGGSGAEAPPADASGIEAPPVEGSAAGTLPAEGNDAEIPPAGVSGGEAPPAESQAEVVTQLPAVTLDGEHWRWIKSKQKRDENTEEEVIRAEEHVQDTIGIWKAQEALQSDGKGDVVDQLPELPEEIDIDVALGDGLELSGWNCLHADFSNKVRFSSEKPAEKFASGPSARSRKKKKTQNDNEYTKPTSKEDFDFFSVNDRNPCEAKRSTSVESYSTSPKNSSTASPKLSPEPPELPSNKAPKGPGGFVYRGAKRRHGQDEPYIQNRGITQHNVSSGKIAPMCLSPPGYVPRAPPMSPPSSAAQHRGEVELLEDAHVSAASGRHLRAQQRMFLRLCPGKGIPSPGQAFWDEEDSALPSEPSPTLKSQASKSPQQNSGAPCIPEMIETSIAGCQTVTPPQSATVAEGTFKKQSQKVVPACAGKLETPRSRQVKVKVLEKVAFEGKNWVRLPPVEKNDALDYSKHLGHFFPCVPSIDDRPSVSLLAAMGNQRRVVSNRWRR